MQATHPKFRFQEHSYSFQPTIKGDSGAPNHFVPFRFAGSARLIVSDCLVGTFQNNCDSMSSRKVALHGALLVNFLTRTHACCSGDKLESTFKWTCWESSVRKQEPPFLLRCVFRLGKVQPMRVHRNPKFLIWVRVTSVDPKDDPIMIPNWPSSGFESPPNWSHADTKLGSFKN